MSDVVMSDVVVVTGPPGAGRSTVAALVVAALGRRVPDGEAPTRASGTAVLVPGDVFFSFWQGGIPPWLPEAHAQNAVALRAAAAATGTFAAAGHPVVYDGVVGPWFLPLFAARVRGDGPPPGVGLHYAVLLPSLRQCRERVRRRVGHGFTDDDATARMHADFAAASDSLDPRHVLRDPAGGPSDVARQVVERYARGELRYPAPSTTRVTAADR